MPVLTKACAMTATAVALVLLAPTALAPTRGPVQAVTTPQPSLSSLTLELIARVTALLWPRILLSFHP
jgi:hypothetical protein